MKSDDYRFTVIICSFFNKLIEDLQMPGMYAIKGANRDSSVFKVGQIIYIPVYLHRFAQDNRLINILGMEYSCSNVTFAANEEQIGETQILYMNFKKCIVLVHRLHRNFNKKNNLIIQ